MGVRYGRGKFTADQLYIEYMNFIARHPNYAGMPNAIDEATGRINWQVSSGKTTSFYKDYLARFQWWVNKADELGLPGTGNSNDRFSIAARLIHPTGLRPCRLCGREWHVGYMYLNANLAKRWNKLSGSDRFYKTQNVVEAATALQEMIAQDAFMSELRSVFPEKFEFLGVDPSNPNLEDFFLRSSHLRSYSLSPGFMGNPPDRLDGFHDYDLVCRPKSDPGRSEENLRSYAHDRRAFEWWAEGDWVVADALYNQAGSGTCANCGREVTRISPDHVGPLACGFKQIPFFIPLCGNCNSSKNRRFTFSDVQALLECEADTGESVASWQVRELWDSCKHLIRNDTQAKHLSNLMRSVQDYYLRALHALLESGMALPLAYLLTPKNALFDVEFIGLDTSTLSYDGYRKTPSRLTKNNQSLVARVVRIAFEELAVYSGKELSERKLRKLDFQPDLEQSFRLAAEFQGDPDVQSWDAVIRDPGLDVEQREAAIAILLGGEYEARRDDFALLLDALREHFDEIGTELAYQFAAEVGTLET